LQNSFLVGDCGVHSSSLKIFKVNNFE